MEPAQDGGDRKLAATDKLVVWFVAVVAMVALAVYQRRTGPTYPVSVNQVVDGVAVSGRLPRTQAGPDGPKIELSVPDSTVAGTVDWRPLRSGGAVSKLRMTRRGFKLEATLPHFPPAAKIAYSIALDAGGHRTSVAEDVVLRYRNDVPATLLVAHVVMMFLGLLFGMRISLAALLNEARPHWWFRWLIPSLLLGGFVLGPMMSWYSFGEIWTGWPIGRDLTDSKTLATTLLWVAAWAVAARSVNLRRAAIVIAVVVMIAVYLIPHSVFGSELDWSKVPQSGHSR